MSRSARAAALAATLALAAGGCGGQEGGDGRATPSAPPPVLAWDGEPREFAATPPATSRVIGGKIRNHSNRRIDLDASEVELRDRTGKRIEGSAVFLSGFVRDRYARNRPETPPPDEERRLSGTLARLEPGETVPLTVSWRAEPGVGRPVVVQVGPVALPVPESQARHAP